MSNLVTDTKSKMEKAIEHLKQEYKTLRSNRVNPNMLDDLKVDVYGAEMTIKSVATVSVQERQLLITPFDPSTAGAIGKAIQQSNFNLNPLVEQNMVRVNVPPLNEELRKDIAKQAKQKSESAKVVVREIRRKSNDTAKKQKADGEIAEDELKKLEKKIQELTDQYCKQLDEIYAAKEKDILTV